MIKEVDYQTRAVKELVEKTKRLLDRGGNRRRIVFEAPTGSGKTVMASRLLDELCPLLTESGQDAAYIWIAPNKLHEQSYLRMKNYFTESHTLRPVVYDEIDHTIEGYIKPGEVLFVNWESINKEKNVMVKDTENSASLYDIVRRTTEERGMRLIVIIDEAHRNTSLDAKKSQAVMERLNANVEILISATMGNATACDEKVNVYREEVIEAEMIKDGITINPKLTDNSGELSADEYLLEKALEKREEIKAAYAKEGARVNPLLLIQLPNDNREQMDEEDRRIVDMVKQRLDEHHDISIGNERLAVWLSGEKTGLNGIERNNNKTDVLLFKEAIALGWDCPRAAVLLIYRETHSETFSAQTVGRITRMPEQKYYTTAVLNHGWVYTNIDSTKLSISNADNGYLSKPLVAHRRENMVNVALTSFYTEHLSADRNRIGPDFWPLLVNTFYAQWIKTKAPACLLENREPSEEEENDDAVVDCIANCKAAQRSANINFNVKRLTTTMLSNVEINGEVGEYRLSDTNTMEYGKTDIDVNKELLNFCESVLVGFEKVSTVTLRGYLLQLMEEVFDMNEKDAPRVMLDKGNNEHFADVINRALDAYREKIKAKQEAAKRRARKEYTWEVPEVRSYNAEANTEVADVKEHALLPFVRLNIASEQEKNFELFLEEHKKYVDWWYKNGDSGRQHYSIPYTDEHGKEDLFYIDFVIRLKNGHVFLFDTKGKDSDPRAVAKHNALVDYLKRQNAQGKNLRGGVLIADKGTWRYSEGKINNTTDLSRWTSFYPDVL